MPRLNEPHWTGNNEDGRVARCVLRRSLILSRVAVCVTVPMIILAACDRAASPPRILKLPADPACTPTASGASFDSTPELKNRSVAWDSARAWYDRTGRKAEAVVNVYVRLDTLGLPLCSAAERLTGDTALRSVAVNAALLTRWTPAFIKTRPVESTVHLGYALCKTEAVQTEQHVVWCAPPYQPGRN